MLKGHVLWVEIKTTGFHKMIAKIQSFSWLFWPFALKAYLSRQAGARPEYRIWKLERSCPLSIPMCTLHIKACWHFLSIDNFPIALRVISHHTQEGAPSLNYVTGVKTASCPFWTMLQSPSKGEVSGEYLWARRAGWHQCLNREPWD